MRAYAGDLFPDPGHEFDNVTQQLFDDPHPPPGADATMTGFVHSNGARVMKCFSPERLPVLTSLASHYAVCQMWFSSVPGPTSPNRMFAHAATLNGSVDSDFLWTGLKTLYELMDEKGVTYGFYTHDATTLLMTVDYFLHRQSVFHDFESEFEHDCAHGTLPQYTWIEPRYARRGNFFPSDQHPDHDVRDGERLIQRVYTALTGNPELQRRPAIAGQLALARPHSNRFTRFSSTERAGRERPPFLPQRVLIQQRPRQKLTEIERSLGEDE